MKPISEQEFLADHVLFLQLTVRTWSGAYRLLDTKTMAGATEIERSVLTDPRAKFFPDELRQKIRAADDAVRVVADRWSLPFALRGLHVIPRMSAQQVMAEIDEKAVDLMKVADEVAAAWPGIRDKMQATLPVNTWKDIEEKLPKDSKQIVAKFGVIKRIIPVSGMAANPNDVNAYATEIQEMTRAFVKETAHTLADGLQAQLDAIVTKLTDRLAKQGIVSEANFRELGDVLKKLEAFESLTGPAVVAEVQKAKQQLAGLTPAQLTQNNRYDNRQLALGLETVLKSVQATLTESLPFSSAPKRTIL